MYNKTKWNKKLQDQDAYQSSWDWTVAHSEYHFDDSIQDQQGEWYEVLGVFKGDWKEESDRLIKVSKPINWQTRKYYGDIDKESPMLEQEEYDIIKGGGSPKELMLTNIVEDWSKFPTLYNMMDWRMFMLWGLFYASFHIINYTFVEPTVHSDHHLNIYSNYGIDIFDILIGTKHNWSDIEDYNHYSINMVLITVLFYFII